MNPIQYESLADSIKVEDITANSSSRKVLDRIKRNIAITVLYIQNEHDEEEAYEGLDSGVYVPEGSNDMGWLGYFVGKSEHLKEIRLTSFTPTSGASVTEVLEPFLMGVNNNRSIQSLDFCQMDLLGGRLFNIFGPFFENSPVLAELYMHECQFGNDGCRLLALAIGSSKTKSLQKVTLLDCNVSDEGLVDIITSLSIHPHLRKLFWTGNRLSTKGCMALATLLRCSATELEHLALGGNEINDEGVDALVPVLKNCSHLHTLVLSNNLAISLKGWRCLATILESPNTSSLTTLYVSGNNIDDEVATTLTSALLSNHTLTSLGIIDYHNPSITNEGWKAFTKLLCDTSTVNSTFLSNHTLGYMFNLRHDCSFQNTLRPLLELNQRQDKKLVAMIKILQNHNDFDMMPFFEWEFKVLPLMINWLERASTTLGWDWWPNIGPRKLSSIYQFVRAMPLLYVEIRLKKELEDINAAELQIEEEYRQRKQVLHDRKRSIMERLGPQK